MGEIVNLNRYRKRRARAAAESHAVEQRARFGRTKAARDLARSETARAARALQAKELQGTAPGSRPLLLGMSEEEVMSRAFVSEAELESGAEALPELPQSSHPNYVTPMGLRLLEERLAEAQAHHQRLVDAPDGPTRELRLAHIAREIRYLEARIERAIPVDPAQSPPDEVAFGALVEVVDMKGVKRRFAIVGEDEADAEHGKVSWASPLARALIGAEVGDHVTWHRPAGEIELVIGKISYPKGR
ncbi:MAG TPA: DUF4169 family protein [Stellaceae bacterium]|nr:DUF4169 family protein [Stellaceae bacterium]